MEKSIKDYIVSRVFGNDAQLRIKENYTHDGFIVGMSVVIPSCVFDNIYLNRAYFKEHLVKWFVSVSPFADCAYPLPCVHFYIDEEE